MIDTSIYRNLLGPVKSVADYDAEYAKGQANAFALQEAQNKQNLFNQSQADDAAVRGAYQGSGGDNKKLLENLRSRGLHKQYDAVNKSLLEADKTRGDIAKDAAETESKKWGVTSGKNKILGQSMQGLMQDPTPDNARRVLQFNLQNGTLTPELHQQMIAELDKDPNPESIRKGAELMFRAAIDAEKQMPKTQTTNAGGNQLYQSIDPVTGKMTQTGSDVITESEAQRLTRERQAADAKAGRDTQWGIAKMVDTRQRDANEATKAVAASNVTAAGLRRDQDTEMKLGDDYRAQSKTFKESTDAFKQISATLDSAQTSPAATLAAATKFMKILDPASVVRESELGMALAATGILDRAGNVINVLQNGKTLTKSQVADFKKVSAEMYEAAKQVQKTIDKDYTEKAKAYKLRPEMIVQELGQTGTSNVIDFGRLK